MLVTTQTRPVRALFLVFIALAMVFTLAPNARATTAASAKNANISIPKYKFKERKVTALVPIQSVFIPQSRKTITVKARKVKVLARGHKGIVQVYFPQFGWANVPYRYVKRNNTLVYDQFLKLWYQIGNDPLGGNEPVTSSPSPDDGSSVPGGGAPAVRGLDESEKEMFNKINNFRSSVGASKLESCRNLNEIAFRWAELMIKYNNIGLSIMTENGRIFLTNVISENAGYDQGDGFKINGWYHILKPETDPFAILSKETLSLQEGYEHIAIAHVPAPNGKHAWVIFLAKQGRCY